MSKIVISDTSCLIALDRINPIEILHKIFDSILTTPTVQQEFENPFHTGLKIVIFGKINQDKEYGY